MARLDARLAVLEACQPKVDPEHERRLSDAIQAVLATVRIRGEWARSTAQPYNYVEQASDLENLWGRIESGALTDGDRKLMASWPKCHVEPAQLVEGLVTVILRSKGA